MKIKRHEKTDNGGVIIYREDEEGKLHGHFIMAGLVEERKVAWDLPDDIDPLDVLLAEVGADPADPMPCAVLGDYESNRARVIAEAKSHAKKVVWPSAKVKAEIRKACDVDDEQKAIVHYFVAKAMQDQGIKHISQKASMARLKQNDGDFEVAQGRANQEREADEIISAMPPHLRRSPRALDPADDVGSPVELTVRFT